MREPCISIICGINGTGKSTFCKKLAAKLRTKTLAVTYSGMPEIWRKYKTIKDIENYNFSRLKKGVRQVHAMNFEDKDCLLKIHDNFSNGLIIFDDCRLYIKPNLDHTKGLKELLGNFRHIGTDIIFVLHDVYQVPPAVWAHASWCYIGKTSRLISYNKIPIDRAAEVLQLQKKVNAAFDAAEARNNNSHYGLFAPLKL